jgi:hypothetical protein
MAASWFVIAVNTACTAMPRVSVSLPFLDTVKSTPLRPEIFAAIWGYQSQGSAELT